jgi:hypothetical protein
MNVQCWTTESGLAELGKAMQYLSHLLSIQSSRHFEKLESNTPIRKWVDYSCCRIDFLMMRSSLQSRDQIDGFGKTVVGNVSDNDRFEICNAA